MSRRLRQWNQAIDREEVIAAGPFQPHAVIAHAFGNLRAEAALGIVDGGVDQIFVAEQKSHQPDRTVVPALDVMDAQIVRQDAFGQGGAEQMILGLFAIVGRKCIPDQIRALGDENEPRRFGEGLRCDMRARARMTLVVVQGITLVFVGVHHQDLAAALRILLFAGDLINDPQIDEFLRKIQMHAHDGVTVEIGCAFGRVPMQNVRADGADVFPFPRADLLALLEASAVLGADVVVAPVPAARGQFDRLAHVAIDIGQKILPRRCERTGDLLLELSDVLSIEQ